MLRVKASGSFFTFHRGRHYGPAADARFNTPRGVVVDGSGVIYVADERNHRVRMIRPE